MEWICTPLPDINKEERTMCKVLLAKHGELFTAGNKQKQTKTNKTTKLIFLWILNSVDENLRLGRQVGDNVQMFVQETTAVALVSSDQPSDTAENADERIIQIAAKVNRNSGMYVDNVKYTVPDEMITSYIPKTFMSGTVS
eukprot:6470672-Amphidinium_carterae.1